MNRAETPELRRPFMATKSTAVATAEQREPIDLSGGLLGVIARAARDPSVDIDKMERLLEMQERVLAREAKTAYAVALAELQPSLPIISERGKILNKSNQVQSTYAFWEDVNEAIRPMLSEAGFSLSFRTGRAGNDITVTGVLTHRDGHSEETTIALPADASGSKNAVQAVASSTSYGKRYTAFALLNITTKGEDDDGKKAGDPPSIDDAEYAMLKNLIEASGANTNRFLEKYGIDAVANLPKAKLKDAVDALNAYALQKRAKAESGE
jgi:hypothetical protein